MGSSDTAVDTAVIAARPAADESKRTNDGVIRPLVRRALRLSLFAKILAANSAIVTLGAVAGTYLTTQHVRVSPHETHVEMMVLFGSVGLALSVAINAVILRAAFRPLAQLEHTARRVTRGDVDARVSLGTVSDPGTEQLAATFNTMLDTLRDHAHRLERYSARLQELSDQVLIAQEEERRRLARELHDETGQELSTLLLGLRLLRDAAGRPDPDVAGLRAQAADLTALARTTLDGVRRLALELRPRMLDDLGLAMALRAYVEEWSARAGVPVTYVAALDDAPPLPATVEIAVYRMVQEGLVNVAKHAGATAVRVSLAVASGALVAEVQDNGRGLPAENGGAPAATAQRVNGSEPAAGDGPSPRDAAGGKSSRTAAPAHSGGLSTGIGLFGTRERIGLAGGTFTVESRPGEGTTLRAVIPLTHRSPAAPAPESADVL